MLNAVVLGGGGADKRLDENRSGSSKGLISIRSKACMAGVRSRFPQMRV